MVQVVMSIFSLRQGLSVQHLPSTSFSSNMACSKTFTGSSRLTEPDNLCKWLRKFKVAANKNEIWDILTGVGAIIDEPDKPDFCPDCTDPMEYNILWARYEIEMEKWKDNANRVRLVRTFLPNCVDPVVEDKVWEYTNP